METIFIATGGTGGHIIPARVLAEKLSTKNFRVFVLADIKYASYEKEEDNFSSIIINSSQLVRSLPALIKASLKISLGIIKSCYYFLRFRPKCVVAFGGYATFPVLLAAIITRRPIILHEQNAHLGKVNRHFAKYAKKIALTFDETSGIADEWRTKLAVVGNPVREEISKLHNKNYQLPKEKPPLKPRDKMGYNVLLHSEFDDFEKYDKQEQETFNILVIGGSGGAKIFSEILPKAFFNLSDHFKNHLHIVQQCRQDLLKSTFEEYKKFNLNVSMAIFFEDMPKEIEAAHLVIARSGSSSIAEFCAAKKPMILIPFAKAADDHQAKNAQILANSGAAIVIKEEDFTINKMTELLKNIISNKYALEKLSQNAGKMANLQAAENLIKLCD